MNIIRPLSTLGRGASISFLKKYWDGGGGEGGPIFPITAEYYRT